jgi:hypothetical protein
VGDFSVAVVVSLGKLTAGHEEYYEREVAGGAEDYYAMRGEAAGEWTGSGAQALGLQGTASGGQLRALLEGRDPASGEMLRSRAVRVTGWDVTYSPPKSVSVLHAAGDARISAETLAAHRTAVRAALGYLESDACWTRRGAGGTTRESLVAVQLAGARRLARGAQLYPSPSRLSCPCGEGSTASARAWLQWSITSRAIACRQEIRRSSGSTVRPPVAPAPSTRA